MSEQDRSTDPTETDAVPVAETGTDTTTGASAEKGTATSAAGRPQRVPQPGPRRGDAYSYYDAMGGAPTFERLVHEFYRRVALDPELRAMYPEQDLRPAERRLRMFLEQYWGGPTTYSQERGHPRLRMRHVDFRVTPTMRDHWLEHMMAAVDSIHLDAPLDEALRHYLTNAANFLVNTPE